MQVAGEPVAHERAEVAHQRRGVLLVRRPDVHGGRIRPVLLLAPPLEVREQVVGEVRRVADPRQHADLVVQLHGDHRAAVAVQPRRDDRQDRLVPPPGLGEERGREVVDGPGGRRRAVPPGRHDLRVLAVEPVGQALVLQLRHHERPGPRDHVQAVVVAQVEERAEVALRPGPPGHVDRAVRQLVPQPRDVGRDRVQPGRLGLVEAVLPQRSADPEVVDLAGQDEDLAAVDDDPLALVVHRVDQGLAPGWLDPPIAVGAGSGLISGKWKRIQDALTFHVSGWGGLGQGAPRPPVRLPAAPSGRCARWHVAGAFL